MFLHKAFSSYGRNDRKTTANDAPKRILQLSTCWLQVFPVTLTTIRRPNRDQAETKPYLHGLGNTLTSMCLRSLWFKARPQGTISYTQILSNSQIRKFLWFQHDFTLLRRAVLLSICCLCYLNLKPPNDAARCQTQHGRHQGYVYSKIHLFWPLPCLRKN